MENAVKKNLLASVAVFALAAGAPAVAADLPIKAPVHKAATAPMSHNWTGCYVGAHVGYGWGHASSYDYDADHLRPSGIFGGGQLGCNWQQTANWVWGIEADIAGADIHDRVFGFKNSDLSYLGTVRGRIGLS
jgi:outer membrane immunogenic protein